MFKACSCFLRDKIGFKAIGLVISAVVISFAVYVLYKELSHSDWGKVKDAIVQSPAKAFLMAGVFTICAYITLTAYDYFATRQIGKDVGYPTSAMGAFASYSIAHNLGATVFTGAVVRFLIYARAGLKAPDVIKITFLAGLTFWLGNATVLGLGFVLEPQVAEPILKNLGVSVEWIRIFGIFILACLAAYIVFVHAVRPAIGKGEWRLELPGSRLTLLQMIIGIVDLTFCASIFYVIISHLPGAPVVPFTAVGVILVASMLLGFASHAPGAVGAFEASLLISLKPLGYSAEQIIAAFILFRLFYFVAPFALAVIAVFLREFVFGGADLASLKDSIATVRQAEQDHHQKPQPVAE